MCRLLFALVIAVIAMGPAAARDSRTNGARIVARSKGTVSKARSMGGHSRSTSGKCVTCQRDANGRIKRDPAARRAFQRQYPCPATDKATGACPGYVVDHVLPLKRGGTDAPANMQWQTTVAGKAKDKIE